MAKEQKKLFFTFVNPNDPKAFEREFRRVLIERLIAEHKQNAAA